MLSLTDPAQKQFNVALKDGELGASRVRVLIDHRCHCGKAHFSLGLEQETPADDTAFDVEGIPFVADDEMVAELPSVEIDFVETVWTKGFTIRNVEHECGAHMMD